MKKFSLFFLVLLITIRLFSNSNLKVILPPEGKLSVAVSEDAIKYSGNEFEEEIDANGKDILISGNNNKLIIKGKALRLIISGKDNDVEVEQVNEILISGNGNFVSWEKSDNASGKPKIKDTGGYNNVGKKSGNALNKSDN